MSKRRIPMIERISIDESKHWNGHPCWNWRGARMKSGYGNAWWNGKVVTAHRLSAYLWLQIPWEDKRHVLHRCDNPSCFNPKHLFMGTHSDNIRDAVSKGRHYSHFRGKTHCKRGHEFTPENTRMTNGGRACRKCNELWSRSRVTRKINGKSV